MGQQTHLLPVLTWAGAACAVPYPVLLLLAWGLAEGRLEKSKLDMRTGQHLLVGSAIAANPGV